MSTATREILEQLERGEIDSQVAIDRMKGKESKPSAKGNHYLRVDVHRLHDEKRKVHVKIPLRIVELGLSLGSKYAPELDDLDLHQIVDELHALDEGTIVEVEDVDEDQHVLVWIEKT